MASPWYLSHSVQRSTSGTMRSECGLVLKTVLRTALGLPSGFTCLGHLPSAEDKNSVDRTMQPAALGNSRMVAFTSASITVEVVANGKISSTSSNRPRRSGKERS
jgi:hypothetical protein